MAEVIGTAAAITQLLGNALELATSIGRFCVDVANAYDTKNGFFAKLKRLGESLEAVSLTLAERQAHLQLVSYENDDEFQILEIALGNLLDCQKTKEMLEKCLGSLGPKNQHSTFGKVKTKLLIDLKFGSIERLEKRVEANLGSLDILISCLNLFAHNKASHDSKLLLSVISENTRHQQVFLEALSKNLLGRSLSLDEIGRGDDDDLNDVETMSCEIASEKYIKKNMRTMAQTIQAANDLVYRKSLPGSEETSEGSREPIGGEPDFPENWQPRRSSDLMSYFTRLLERYTEHAKDRFEVSDYDSCLNSIEGGIEQGELRYAQYHIPFDTYLELQLLRTKVYQRQGFFSKAEKLLAVLIDQVEQKDTDRYQITSEDLGTLYWAMAQLHLEKYNKEKDSAVIPNLLNAANNAYAFSLDLHEEHPDPFAWTRLNHKCAALLLQAAKLKGDPVLAEELYERHPLLVREAEMDEVDKVRSQESRNQKLPQPLRGRNELPVNPPPIIHTHPPSDVELCPQKSHVSRISGSLVTSKSGKRRSSFLSSSPSLRSTDGRSSSIDTNSSWTQNPPNLISLVESSNPEAVRYFLEARRDDENLGAIIEETNSAGLTPLLIAAKNRQISIFQLLLENGAQITATDNKNLGILHHALIGGQNDELVELIRLIAADLRVDLNVIEGGYTPLTYCVECGYYLAAKALLDIGCLGPDRRIDLEKRNSHGETAAIIAARRKNVEMLKLLHSKGARFTSKRIDPKMRLLIKEWDKERAR